MIFACGWGHICIYVYGRSQCLLCLRVRVHAVLLCVCVTTYHNTTRIVRRGRGRAPLCERKRGEQEREKERVCVIRERDAKNPARHEGVFTERNTKAGFNIKL